jgi:hypothetical protein
MTWTEAEIAVASNWSDGRARTLTFVQNEVYEDGIFKYGYDYYDCSYFRILKELWIDGGCDIDIVDRMKSDLSMDEWFVYISTHTKYKDLNAIIMNRISSPLGYIKCSRTNKTSKFSFNAYGTVEIQMFEGNRTTGYYISEFDYRSNLGPAMSSALCISENLSDYDPANWKKWADVNDQFS